MRSALTSAADAGGVSGVRYNRERLKRLFRILVNAGAGLSLLLCAATLVVWVRSYWVGDQLYHSRWTLAAGEAGRVRAHERAVFLMSARGGLAIEVRLQDAIW